MENLIIKEVEDSPYYPSVNFNSETGVCEISGESYMEEAFKFFSPLLDWLKTYTSSKKGKLTFNCKLTYFNTSSSRLILDILDILRDYKDNGGDIEVKWFYDSQDPDMEDEVEDFMIESGIDITMVSF